MTDEQNNAIATATKALKGATDTFAHVVACASLTFKDVVAEQVKALKAVKLDDKAIAKIVKDAVGGACTPQNISKALKSAGVSQRKSRSDKGVARILTGVAKTAIETALVPAGGKDNKPSKGITLNQILKLIENAPEDVQKGVVTSELIATLTQSLINN